MSAKKSIPVHVRQRVAEEAWHRCGYCLRTEELMGMPMTLDHIIPEAAGGPSSEENLWLACRPRHCWIAAESLPMTSGKARGCQPNWTSCVVIDRAEKRRKLLEL